MKKLFVGQQVEVRSDAICNVCGVHKKPTAVFDVSVRVPRREIEAEWKTPFFGSPQKVVTEDRIQFKTHWTEFDICGNCAIQIAKALR